MAKQPKNNIGNVMIITPNRERTKTTTHVFIRADNSVKRTGNSIDKLLKNYWGVAPVQYKSFSIANDIIQFCPQTQPPGFGMMTFIVPEIDVLNSVVTNISTEAYNEANLGEFPGNLNYRFVLEGYFIWRINDSDYAANGFGYMADNDGLATHILATYGKEQRGANIWYYLILRAGNKKNGIVEVIDEYTGGGGDPPGSGCPIPPPTN